MELEKKKIRPTKKSSTGVMIRYHSTSMPIIDDKMDVDMSADDTNNDRCERTFITIENDIDNKVFNSIFKLEQKKAPSISLCAITK